jgi:hypothetical protein
MSNMRSVPTKKTGKASPMRLSKRKCSGEMYVLNTAMSNNKTVANENPVIVLATNV